MAAPDDDLPPDLYGLATPPRQPHPEWRGTVDVPGTDNYQEQHMSEFARGFRLTYPDGTQYDGAQFPNGFVITCHREAGLTTGAISMEHLLEGMTGVQIEWDAPAAPAGETGQ